MEKPSKWSFYKIWNESLKQAEQREPKPRDYIWASELGGAYIDRFLRMKGVAPSNPHTARSLRKFEAGNLMEWVVQLVLQRAGILISTQDYVEHQYPGMLAVKGKLDFLAGTDEKPDWEMALAEVRQLGLPDFFDRATKNIVRHLADKYPEGLAKIILEIKSAAKFMYELYEKQGPAPNHAMQDFHYLIAKGLDEGHVCYICKDDLRMLEFAVFNPGPVEDLYKADIEVMTKYYKANEQPPLEQEIIFDDKFQKFSANYKIAYSQYITRLYGYKDQEEFDLKFKPTVSRWNRVFKRCVDEQNMTPKNLEVLEEIKPKFPNFDELVGKAKLKKENADAKAKVGSKDN